MVEVEARRAEAGPASKAPVLVLRHEKAPVKVVSFEELETNWRRKRWPPKENRPYQSAYEPSTLEPVINAYDEPLVAGACACPIDTAGVPARKKAHLRR